MKTQLFLIFVTAMNVSFASNLSMVVGEYTLLSDKSTTDCPSTFQCLYDKNVPKYHCFGSVTEDEDYNSKRHIDIPIYLEKINRGAYSSKQGATESTTVTTLENNIVTITEENEVIISINKDPLTPVLISGYTVEQTLTPSVGEIRYTYERSPEEAVCVYTKK